MPRLIFVVVAIVTFAGCDWSWIPTRNSANPQSCGNDENIGTDICIDGGGGDHCSRDRDCPDKMNFPDCETMAGPHVNTCVQCTAMEHSLCTGATPLCRDDTCTACTQDNECGNGSDSLCLPNGSCALLSDVAYVDGTNGVDTDPCTMTNPCTRIDKAASMKPVVKVSGTVQNRCSLDGKTVTILGQSGAKIIPTGGGTNDGPALEIRGASHVEVYDLEIDQATGGISKDASGVLVTDTADLLMTRVKLQMNSADGAHVTGGHLTCRLCTISQNVNLGIDVTAGLLTVHQSTIRDNTSGGISVSSVGSFQIVGNVIFHNGQATKVAGGISINVDGSATNRLDFNSLSRNTATPTGGQSIRCDSGIPFTANNNIIWDTTSTTLLQISGACTHAYSNIGPLPVQSGTNMTMPPQFKDENNGDLHLTSTSPARRMADPAADLKGLAAFDIDNEPRVPRADIGADQTP